MSANTELQTTEETPGEWMNEVMARASELGSNSIEHRKPAMAAKALWLLARGTPILHIYQQTGIDRQAIRNLSWRHKDTLETKRKDFSRKYAMAAEATTDLLMQKLEMLEDDREQLAAISPDKLAVTIGIMTDKAAMLSGMAGQVIEVRRGASIDDAMKAITEARERIAKGRTIEAEVLPE